MFNAQLKSQTTFEQQHAVDTSIVPEAACS